MSARFIKQTRDGNHKELCDAVNQHAAYEAIETFHPLDVLIFNRHLGIAGWAEIKTEKRDAKIQRTQIEFMSKTSMPVAFVKTVEEMLEFTRTMMGITDKQKHNLSEFLRDPATKKRKAFHPAVLERILGWE